ncbi:YciI family protein [Paenibacillus sp. 1011MAR3C5]|uniref:YciI family protein n=1 Tax=Paenibacillus sp. 1011MAR3C5 TaxID=1675787 RepID=UPI000E6C1F4E|nr:YciI family protein [Paenibacillus sp. 1011MAR3C5]RJE89600.1 YciI family protein [Paenibacillus sp. 1011MAR3C5]
MRFMVMVKATGYFEAGIRDGREHSGAKDAFLKNLQDAGVFLSAEELLPSSSGIRVVFPPGGGAPAMQSGPFLPEQEWIAGYTVIDVDTEEEALKWALRMPLPPEQGEHVIEVRRLASRTDYVLDARTQAMKADLQDQLSLLHP